MDRLKCLGTHEINVCCWAPTNPYCFSLFALSKYPVASNFLLSTVQCTQWTIHGSFIICPNTQTDRNSSPVMEILSFWSAFFSVFFLLQLHSKLLLCSKTFQALKLNVNLQPLHNVLQRNTCYSFANKLKPMECRKTNATVYDPITFFAQQW